MLEILKTDLVLARLLERMEHKPKVYLRSYHKQMRFLKYRKKLFEIDDGDYQKCIFLKWWKRRSVRPNKISSRFDA